MNDNPLLDDSGLPRFASIRAEHVRMIDYGIATMPLRT